MSTYVGALQSYVVTAVNRCFAGLYTYFKSPHGTLMNACSGQINVQESMKLVDRLQTSSPLIF